MKTMISFAILLALWLTAACQASPVETLPTTVSSPPAQGEPSQMTPSPSTPVEPALQNVVNLAKEDLAQRLNIAGSDVNLVEVTEVEWSDASLDCPQPGIDYIQVITPGYRILLEVNAQTYEYHSNRDNYVVYCESATPSIPPKP